MTAWTNNCVNEYPVCEAPRKKQADLCAQIWKDYYDQCFS